MSVTIEDVMAVAVSYGYGPRKWTDELRASIEALVAQARDEEAEACAWAVMCDGNTVSACLTETAANLIAENLREKNRGRDFSWRVVPLYARIAGRKAQDGGART